VPKRRAGHTWKPANGGQQSGKKICRFVEKGGSRVIAQNFRIWVIWKEERNKKKTKGNEKMKEEGRRRNK